MLSGAEATTEDTKDTKVKGAYLIPCVLGVESLLCLQVARTPVVSPRPFTGASACRRPEPNGPTSRPRLAQSLRVFYRKKGSTRELSGPSPRRREARQGLVPGRKCGWSSPVFNDQH